MVDRANKPSAISAGEKAPQPTVDISADNGTITATLPTKESVTVLLHGATVTSWKGADGTENLWLSDKAILDGSKPVRGGVPVVFPVCTTDCHCRRGDPELTCIPKVFGPPPKNHATSTLPQHGFARNTRWEFLGKSTSEGETVKGADDSVKLDFGLYSTALPEAAKKAWPYDFGVVYSVTLSKEGLQTVVNVRNEGKESFEFQFLLHTYLRVKVRLIWRWH